ncbi:Protein CBG26833 [Caenorhabditis briggsae]|uniref:Protein CBG26833 n=1 Tax=Caenorhabditis briggsae TaxID=6238 RepID=B6IKE2_CAEBR|nr:Protein CBG26833 [Caenorhabditis briggsae]CAS00372.1 Protein CBG26833 [Caenorhabditis briggsae]
MVLSYTGYFLHILEGEGNTWQVQPATLPGAVPATGSTSIEEEIGTGDEMIIKLHNIVNSINLFIQLACIIFLCNKIQSNKGPFYLMILIFSISVSFLVFSSIVLILRTRKRDSHLLVNLTNLSLYVDYCSNLFSVTITFCLSLKRCLCFVSEKWNSRIFDKCIFPVIFSVIISIAGAMGMIITSKIKRIYLMFFGFVDLVPNCFSEDNEGFRVSINRLFNAFSFGSVICYMILFKHLLQQNKIVFTVSVLRKRAKNRVFYHLLITAILYLIVNALYEALVYGPSLLGDLLGISLVDPVDMMKTLVIANYFPEIYLPLLFILDTGPFFSMILIFSICVSLRIVFSSIVLILRTRKRDSHLLVNLTNLSLYVDYCSNLFSVTITFCLSLKRCLCFVSEKWYSRIFEKWIFLVILSVIISIAGAMGMIITSKIKRMYYIFFGFIDIVPNLTSEDNEGFRVIVNSLHEALIYGLRFLMILL